MFDPPLNSEIITGSYNLGLVALSYLIAVFASFAALDMFANTEQVPKKFFILWIAGCGFCMGGGIWSMHFVGMLAYHLPMAVNYDEFLTLISFVIAVLATSLAFYISRYQMSLVIRIITGGIIMGIGIAAMHYTGMAAMLIQANLYYDLTLFLLSIFIAIAASAAVLRLTDIYTDKYYDQPPFALKLLSSLVMGAAIVGMHYTGMSATVIVPDPDIPFASKALPINLLAWFIGTTNILILSMVLITSRVYKHFGDEELQMMNSEKVFWMSNPDLTALHSVSQGYETIWGRSSKQLMKNPEEWLDSIHPNDRERVRAFRRPEKLAAGDLLIKYRIYRPDGSMRWIQDRTYPIKDASDKVLQIAGVAEDITGFPPRYIQAPDDSTPSPDH